MKYRIEIWQYEAMQGARLVEQKEAKTKAESVRWIKSKVCTESTPVLYGWIFDRQEAIWIGRRAQGKWMEVE